MDATRFDTIARLFAAHRFRRQALIRARTGLAAGLAAAGLARPSPAQEAASDATLPADDGGKKVEYLFLLAFRGGSVAPKEGAEDRYTLTLEQGLGQTVYFSDRPERVVGASPTPQFLAGLGFSDDNPPNAALVVAGPENEDIAVLELYNSQYDEATHTATYDVTALAAWEESPAMGISGMRAGVVWQR